MAKEFKPSVSNRFYISLSKCSYLRTPRLVVLTRGAGFSGLVLLVVDSVEARTSPRCLDPRGAPDLEGLFCSR